MKVVDVNDGNREIFQTAIDIQDNTSVLTMR